MNKLNQYYRSSLSRTLSVMAALLASAVFFFALAFMFDQARETVRKEAMDHATEELNNTVQRVNTILVGIQEATANTLWYVKRQLDHPDSMLVYSRGFLESHPEANGCSIAFEPYYFKEKGRYFSAYAGYRTDGSLVTTVEGSQNYEYFYMDWYQLSKLLDRPAWTDPFLDVDTDIDDQTDMIVSYGMPIKDAEGNYVGTISTDLSLDWLSSTISAVKPYPNSYSIMLGRNGTYFVHPDPSKLLYESIFTETLEKDNPERTKLGMAMVHGEEGVQRTFINGERCYVFYKPLGDSGWSVGIVCPESDIFGGFRRLRNAVSLIFLLGVIIMLVVLIRIIRNQLKPLEVLADQAEVIANGDFERALPEDDRIDEIGRLEQSFTHMQQSLVKYIDEVKSTAAAKASIENELKVASDIQMSMVPRIFPPFPDRDDIDLFGSMSPAKEVGGDLFDFFVQDDKLYFCVGDVSGKGIPASLFMAVTRNLFRIIAQQGYSPEEIATMINHSLSAENDQGMFVTMFIGKADLQTGRLDFCNCGHNPPVVNAPGQPAHFLPTKYVNIALGMMDGMEFQGESIDNIREWQFLAYTDGLNEAENPEYELFGNDRLIEIMDTLGSENSATVIRVLQEEVEKHRNGATPSDDLTLLCLRLTKNKK